MTAGPKTDRRSPDLVPLSSPSGSQEGGNEPSCRALSAEFDTVGPIPPGAAGGPLVANLRACAHGKGGPPR